MKLTIELLYVIAKLCPELKEQALAIIRDREFKHAEQMYFSEAPHE